MWLGPLSISSNVTNIVSANISPRVQKEIIEIIGENVGKHRQYIGKIKNTKIFKNTKNTKNHNTLEYIGKYRHKIGKYHEKSSNIVKKSGKIAKKIGENIEPIYRKRVNIAMLPIYRRYL